MFSVSNKTSKNKITTASTHGSCSKNGTTTSTAIVLLLAAVAAVLHFPPLAAAGETTSPIHNNNMGGASAYEEQYAGENPECDVRPNPYTFFSDHSWTGGDHDVGESRLTDWLRSALSSAGAQSNPSSGSAEDDDDDDDDDNTKLSEQQKKKRRQRLNKMLRQRLQLLAQQIIEDTAATTSTAAAGISTTATTSTSSETEATSVLVSGSSNDNSHSKSLFTQAITEALAHVADAAPPMLPSTTRMPLATPISLDDHDATSTMLVPQYNSVNVQRTLLIFIRYFVSLAQSRSSGDTEPTTTKSVVPCGSNKNHHNKNQQHIFTPSGAQGASPLLVQLHELLHIMTVNELSAVVTLLRAMQVALVPTASSALNLLDSVTSGPTGKATSERTPAHSTRHSTTRPLPPVVPTAADADDAANMVYGKLQTAPLMERLRFVRYDAPCSNTNNTNGDGNSNNNVCTKDVHTRLSEAVATVEQHTVSPVRRTLQSTAANDNNINNNNDIASASALHPATTAHIVPLGTELPPTAVRLFFGQLRREHTTHALLYMLQEAVLKQFNPEEYENPTDTCNNYTTSNYKRQQAARGTRHGIKILRVQSHTVKDTQREKGAAWVYVDSQRSADIIVTLLHKRVFHDVIILRNPAAQQQSIEGFWMLQDYNDTNGIAMDKEGKAFVFNTDDNNNTMNGLVDPSLVERVQRALLRDRESFLALMQHRAALAQRAGDTTNNNYYEVDEDKLNKVNPCTVPAPSLRSKLLPLEPLVVEVPRAVERTRTGIICPTSKTPSKGAHNKNNHIHNNNIKTNNNYNIKHNNPYQRVPATTSAEMTLQQQQQPGTHDNSHCHPSSSCQSRHYYYTPSYPQQQQDALTTDTSTVPIPTTATAMPPRRYRHYPYSTLVCRVPTHPSATTTTSSSAPSPVPVHTTTIITTTTATSTTTTEGCLPGAGEEDTATILHDLTITNTADGSSSSSSSSSSNEDVPQQQLLHDHNTYNNTYSDGSLVLVLPDNNKKDNNNNNNNLWDKSSMHDSTTCHPSGTTSPSHISLELNIGTPLVAEREAELWGDNNNNYSTNDNIIAPFGVVDYTTSSAASSY